MRFQVIKESLIAAIITLGLVFVISHLPIKGEFIKPIKQGLDDFDVYDLVYSVKTPFEGKRDKDIILIEAAEGRKNIARQIDKLEALHPKVIGIDMIFDPQKDVPGASAIINSCVKDSGIVYAYLYDSESSGESLRYGRNIFPATLLEKDGGYLYFSGDEFSVVRKYRPFYSKSNYIHSSFTSRIIQKYSEAAFKRLTGRKSQEENINYFGNLEKYLSFNINDFEYYLKKGELSDKVKGKIVLLGAFASTDKEDKPIEDLKFTPLNKRFKGRSYPDMYGIVIHANILSMILNEAYITEASIILSYIISFIFSFLLAYYMTARYRKGKHPSHLKLAIIQLVTILLFIYACLQLFALFRLKVEILPVVLGLVLSIEMFVYKSIAAFLHKKIGYKTVFSTP